MSDSWHMHNWTYRTPQLVVAERSAVRRQLTRTIITEMVKCILIHLHSRWLLTKLSRSLFPNFVPFSCTRPHFASNYIDVQFDSRHTCWPFCSVQLSLLEQHGKQPLVHHCNENKHVDQIIIEEDLQPQVKLTMHLFLTFHSYLLPMQLPTYRNCTTQLFLEEVLIRLTERELYKIENKD